MALLQQLLEFICFILQNVNLLVSHIVLLVDIVASLVEQALLVALRQTDDRLLQLVLLLRKLRGMVG